jgi:hypothetical protein
MVYDQKPFLILDTYSEFTFIDNESVKKCATDRGASILCDQSIGTNCYENRK